MSSSATSRIARWLAALLILAALAFLVSLNQSGPSSAPSQSDGTSIALGQLPRAAKQTWRQIHQGGPFEYEKDGTVFGNRERILPAKNRGFYREYTVKTSGSQGRGARRIVCGGLERTRPKTCYYTSDHYSSFKRIVEQ